MIIHETGMCTYHLTNMKHFDLFKCFIKEVETHNKELKLFKLIEVVKKISPGYVQRVL